MADADTKRCFPGWRGGHQNGDYPAVFICSESGSSFIQLARQRIGRGPSRNGISAHKTCVSWQTQDSSVFRRLAIIKLILSAALALALGPAPASAKDVVSPPVSAAIPYGANKAASGIFVHDGVTFYYETYGTGEPLLLVHGNGGSIGWMAAQIAYFMTHRRVIVMDSRDAFALLAEHQHDLCRL